MKKILIINLKRLGDVYTTSHLINSILKESPTTEISLLVYEESLQAAQNLKGVSQIHSIDRKKTITLAASQIFSDALAFERFYQSIRPMQEVQWDEVINYSNDSVSSLICSSLSNTITGRKIGPSFDSLNCLQVNSDWDHIFNDVMTQTPHVPIHFQDCYHKMCDVNLVPEGEKIRFNPRHNQNAFKNLKKLRSHFSNDSNINLVGLQLTSSAPEKAPHRETYIQLIKKMMKTNLYVPVLLVAPTSSDRQVAQEINSQFQNKLVVAEADLSALASVMINLDFVITPDTVTKHIADLTETPCLEISLGEAPFLKQGTRFNKSFILSCSLSKRIFSNKLPNTTLDGIHDQRDLISAQDIFACLDYILQEDEFKPRLAEHLSLYTPVHDSFGLRYDVIGGEVPYQHELQRLLHRVYLSALLKDPSESDMQDVFHRILELSRESIDDKSWLENEKALGSQTTRDLLSTLRSLLVCQDNPKKVTEFVYALDQLLTHCDGISMSSIATQLFKGRLEALGRATLSQNIKQVEFVLYQLKTDLQLSFSCIKDIENIIQEDRRQRTHISSAQWPRA